MPRTATTRLRRPIWQNTKYSPKINAQPRTHVDSALGANRTYSASGASSPSPCSLGMNARKSKRAMAVVKMAAARAVPAPKDCQMPSSCAARPPGGATTKTHQRGERQQHAPEAAEDDERGEALLAQPAQPTRLCTVPQGEIRRDRASWLRSGEIGRDRARAAELARAMTFCAESAKPASVYTARHGAISALGGGWGEGVSSE